MTAEEKVNPPQKRPILLSPWLVLLGALILYGITLNHWVTLRSLPVVAKVTGWDWHPIPLQWRLTQLAPLFLVLTSPVRLLPVAWQPVALNAFAALCAALALALLAASVRLLPHDRTREQRQREAGEFALLSVPMAFLPVLFAVLMMGLQLTFWRNAIAATGEMLDVLVFAFLIFCLLKFRISQNDNWLSIFAFVYGLGTTNNWALLGFFPLFFIALVWIKGVNFFNWRFLARIAGCGFLGLLLYVLIPALGSLGAERANFWSLLHMELGAQSFALHSVPRWVVLVAALPTLLPLIFAGICWPSFEGELSAMGNLLNRTMFRLLHVFFLLLALSMFFDFKHSPSLVLQETSLGFLTFFYMGALAIGYFSGYMLLVYGKSIVQTWEKRAPLIKAFNRLVVALLWLLALAAPCWLFYQNISRINAGRGGALEDYARQMIQGLPAKPSVILSDDPAQMYLLEAELSREGKPGRNILIDSGSMQHREYVAYLISHYPELKKVTADPKKLPPVLPPEALINYLFGLSREYALYYLHPSFGYYFEAFYLKPHGLVYQLQTYPTNSVQPPLTTADEYRENQDFWAKLDKKSLTVFPDLAKLDPDAAWVSGNYSVALDFWGVDLQKAGRLQEANAQFAEAARINPRNFIARINKEYNERLQRNDHKPINSGDLIYKLVTLYHGFVPILKFNGPVDEPDVNLEFGSMMADGRDYRQAAALFERRLQLLPGDPSAELDLAKVFVDSGHEAEAFEMIRKLHANPAASKWEVARVESLAYFAKHDFLSSERLMLNALKESPHDEKRISILAEFYRSSAYTALRETNAPEAGRRFTNALAFIDQELQALTLASHNSSNPFGVPETLLKKAEVQMMLKSFDGAIVTLNKVMDLQPENATALLNRAVAEVQLNQIPTAREDFKALRKLMPKQPYVADYYLAELASREKNSSEEIRYLKRYLNAAPPEQAQYRQAKLRLKKLESQ